MSKSEKKAKIRIAKAEDNFDRQKFKKAAKLFQKAGEYYFGIDQFQIAEQCFFYTSKCYVQMEDQGGAAAMLRLCANCALLYENLEKARDFYDIAAKTVMDSNAKDQDSRAIINVCFAYLCLFLGGFHEKAIQYIKKMKNYVDIDDFQENNLVILISKLSQAILTANENVLAEVIELFPRFKFRRAELSLIRSALVVAKANLDLELTLEINSDTILNNTVFNFGVVVDPAPLKDIEDNKILQYKISHLIIKDLRVSISDNLGILSRPEVPLSIQKKTSFPFELRANFPGDAHLGPIVFLVEVDKKYRFYCETAHVPIKVVNPDADLEVEYNPLETPILNQKFPLEVVLQNRSKGEALNLRVQLEFPEELRLMRGTFEKVIYSLGSKESFKWQLQVKAFEPGEILVKTTVLYEDSEGNEIGPKVYEKPVEINL